MEYELTNQWLKKANDDYTSAKILMEKVLPPQIELSVIIASSVQKKP